PAARAESISSFDLHTADGPPLTGPLLTLHPDGSAALGGSKPMDVPAGQLVSLRRTATPLPPHPVAEHLALADGDPLAGSLLTLCDVRLRLRAQAGELGGPLSAVALIWLAAPDRADDAEMFLRRLATQRRTRDVVHLRNGDTVEGTLNEIDAKTVRVEVQGKEVQVERTRAAAGALNTELPVPPRRE